MVPRKKQYQTGEAANYVSRKQAMKKLQLDLKDFRRLCILKGIHPREPRNRRRAQKGDLTKVQTLFHEKDIRFLLHEPIVWKFRDFKIFLRKLKRATAKGNYETARRLKANKPKYDLDHLVKERYPSFVDAIRDLEDCLCLCFLYATFPMTGQTPVEMVTLCRRLTVEFMHFVIESRALRKVFVSIKGYYYQAEIMGQTVTWVVPHSFAYEPPTSVDLKLMSIFVEFYTTMLGFVNFRLYHNLNLNYPPALTGFDSNLASGVAGKDKQTRDEVLGERVAALNQSLVRTVTNMGVDDEAVELDHIPVYDDPEKMEEAKKQAEEIKGLQGLFKGLKIFLGREVPRESLVFMIRALGGEVSWDRTVTPGSTFTEEDDSVTHQISDRTQVPNQRLGRYYIQPQWIFDSINRRQLLPVHQYFVGETLPPHLSPFITDRRIGDYMPPEEKQLLGLEEEKKEDEKTKSSAAEEEEESDGDENDDDDEEEEEESDMEEEEEGAESKMKVEVGRPEKEDQKLAKKQMEDEELKLRKMMIKNKHRRLHSSMMKNRKRRVHEAKQLERKRKIHDEVAAQKAAAASPKGKKTPKSKASATA